MRLRGKKAITKFQKKHNTSRKRLDDWIRVVEKSDWKNLVEIQTTYKDAEFVRKKDRYVFNLGGNEFRVITQIVFTAKTVLVTDVLTHAEYDKWCK